MELLRPFARVILPIAAVGALVLLSAPFPRGGPRPGAPTALRADRPPVCLILGEDSLHQGFASRDTIVLLPEPDPRERDTALWYRVRGGNLFRHGSFRWRPVSGDSADIRHYHGLGLRLSLGAVPTGRQMRPDRLSVFEYFAEGGIRASEYDVVKGRSLSCEELPTGYAS